MRIALLSDIHEDIVSLKKILRKIEKTGYDKLICLGDVSGFSVPYYKYTHTRNAHECLSLLREKCSVVVPGNHDFYAAQIIPEHSAIFDFPQNWYDLDYYQHLEMSNGKIWLHEENDLNPLYSNDDIAFLRSLPEYYILESPEGNILFSHYAYPNLSGFQKKFYSTGADFDPHFKFMENNNCNLSFTGHAHISGFYVVTRESFKQYRFNKVKLKAFPVCLGILPVTSQENRNGFCIFDTESLFFKAIRS